MIWYIDLSFSISCHSHPFFLTFPIRSSIHLIFNNNLLRRTIRIDHHINCFTLNIVSISQDYYQNLEESLLNTYDQNIN